VIAHYFVSFKGHKCALVVNLDLTEGWLLRCHKVEEPHKFIPAPNRPTPVGDSKREWAIAETHREMTRIIERTEADRSVMGGSLFNLSHPLVKRLVADKPDTRKRARRWRIVPVHGGKKR
jgi:hypothetical protein